MYFCSDVCIVCIFRPASVDSMAPIPSPDTAPISSTSTFSQNLFSNHFHITHRSTYTVSHLGVFGSLGPSAWRHNLGLPVVDVGLVSSRSVLLVQNNAKRVAGGEREEASRSRTGRFPGVARFGLSDPNRPELSVGLAWPACVLPGCIPPS